MPNTNRQRGVLHEGRESRVLQGDGNPNNVINADKGTLFIQRNISPLVIWKNNNGDRAWEQVQEGGGSILSWGAYDFIQGAN